MLRPRGHRPGRILQSSRPSPPRRLRLDRPLLARWPRTAVHPWRLGDRLRYLRRYLRLLHQPIHGAAGRRRRSGKLARAALLDDAQHQLQQGDHQLPDQLEHQPPRPTRAGQAPHFLDAEGEGAGQVLCDR